MPGNVYLVSGDHAEGGPERCEMFATRSFPGATWGAGPRRLCGHAAAGSGGRCIASPGQGLSPVPTGGHDLPRLRAAAVGERERHRHCLGVSRGTAAALRYRLCAMHGCQRQPLAAIPDGVALWTVRIPLLLSRLLQPLVRSIGIPGLLRRVRHPFPPRPLWLRPRGFPPWVTSRADAAVDEAVAYR